MLAGRAYLDGAYPVHDTDGTELKAPNSIRTQYRSNYSEVKILVFTSICITIIIF